MGIWNKIEKPKMCFGRLAQVDSISSVRSACRAQCLIFLASLKVAIALFAGLIVIAVMGVTIYAGAAVLERRWTSWATRGQDAGAFSEPASLAVGSRGRWPDQVRRMSAAIFCNSSDSGCSNAKTLSK